MGIGRPKGSPNKRSQMLMNKLERDNNFHVVKELIEIYNQNKTVVLNLADKMAQNIANGVSPTFEFNGNDLEMYHKSNKRVLDILVRLLSYLYPKLKALEVNSGTTDKVVFNINTVPDITSGTERPQPKIIPFGQQKTG